MPKCSVAYKVLILATLQAVKGKYKIRFQPWNPPSVLSPLLHFGKGQWPAAVPPPLAGLPHLSWGASGERSRQSKIQVIRFSMPSINPCLKFSCRVVWHQEAPNISYHMFVLLPKMPFVYFYLWLLGQRAGQVLRREVSRACSGGFTVSFPKGRRKGGVAGEEKGSGRTNSLLNQRRTCCKKHHNLSKHQTCISTEPCQGCKPSKLVVVRHDLNMIHTYRYKYIWCYGVYIL